MGEQKAQIELRGSNRRFNVSTLWPPTALINRKPSYMVKSIQEEWEGEKCEDVGRAMSRTGHREPNWGGVGRGCGIGWLVGGGEA